MFSCGDRVAKDTFIMINHGFPAFVTRETIFYKTTFVEELITIEKKLIPCRFSHPCRYSNESYMTKRNNPRQGFNGNYRRSNSGELPKTPSSPTTPTTSSSPQLITSGSTTTSGQRREHGGPPSPVSAAPPKSETLVKVATVMTVNKSLPAAESKTQMESGPQRTPTSGGPGIHQYYQSHHHAGPPPPVPPKKGRSAPKPAPSQEGAAPTEERHGPVTTSDTSPKTPEPFVLSARPGVTNLDEASSLLTQLSAGRNGVSPPGMTAWTTVTTPTAPSSRAQNGHADPKLPSPDASLTRPAVRVGRSGRGHSPPSMADSPPTLPSSPPPSQPSDTGGGVDHDLHACSAKETASQEEKEKSESQETPEDAEEQSPTSDASPASPPSEEVSAGGSGGLSPLHVRQKSQEEIDCDKVAAVVAIQIVDDDKQLSDVILPPPEHKMTTDYMSGLFDVGDLPAKPPSFVTERRSPRVSSAGIDDHNKENRRR